jgi:fructose transport system substrate-binding protein
MKKKFRSLCVTASALTAYVFLGSASASSEELTFSLITKTNENPVFVLMREAAEAKAKELGVKLISFAGKYDGDNASQVDAIENSISAGAKVIVIVPNDTTAIVPQVQAARAAGVIVMVADSPLVPVNAADGTWATNNFAAGQLIGKWAAATLGDKAKDARIAMLNADTMMVTNDVARDNGFLTGFGIEVPNRKVWGSETDKRVIGHDVTKGSPSGGQTAVENMLQKDPTINVVFTMNEQSASGAAQGLKAAGRDKDVLLVSVDGTCAGIEMVRNGTIGATSMQFWLNMATDAMQAAMDKIKTGAVPPVTPGLEYIDSGTKLVTDHPAPGVPSITSDEALKLRGDMCKAS